jgi:choline dehydrogenase-like flavoprotein
MRYLPEIERLFELPHGGYEAPEYAQSVDGTHLDFNGRWAKWPAFRLRNLASVLAAPLRHEARMRVWVNATVTRLPVNESGRVEGAVATSLSGITLSVTAPTVIVAAGAIESTRLLLVLDRQNDERLFAPDQTLGRYFYDHLSAPVADLAPASRAALNQLTGFRFQGSGMRNLRFELSAEARVRHRLPGAFAHVGFTTTGPGGFEALRSLLQAVQKRQLPRTADLALLAANLPWLARAVWWRYVHHQLLAPSDAQFELHVVMEQEPVLRNRITLSRERIDALGMPVAAIDWQVTDRDLNYMSAVCERMIDSWRGSRLSGLASVIPRPMTDISAAMICGGGIYHPGGTTRIGRAANRGVVDDRLRVHRIPNLRTVSTAVFPSGGSANPTLMLMLYALRLADDVAEASRK